MLSFFTLIFLVGQSHSVEGAQVTGGWVVGDWECWDVYEYECPEEACCDPLSMPEPRKEPCTYKCGFCKVGEKRDLKCDGCGIRTEICVQPEIWVPHSGCKADPVEVACGEKCGTSTKTCSTEGKWIIGECIDEGECKPGTTKSEACGNGFEKTAECSKDCAWVWGICDECTPGEMKNESCKECGNRTKECTAEGKWAEEWGECIGKTTTMDSEDCEKCGEKTRACQEDGSWGDFGECQGQGECEAGTTATAQCGTSGQKTRECDEGCTWGTWGACNECTPGIEEIKECNDCGKKKRVCSNAGAWGEWSSCYKSPTAPSPTTESCGNKCGKRTKTCGSDGKWVFGACEGEKECEKGSTKQVSCSVYGQDGENIMKTYTCSADCEWKLTQDCPKGEYWTKIGSCTQLYEGKGGTYTSEGKNMGIMSCMPLTHSTYSGTKKSYFKATCKGEWKFRYDPMVIECSTGWESVVGDKDSNCASTLPGGVACEGWESQRIVQNNDQYLLYEGPSGGKQRGVQMCVNVNQQRRYIQVMCRGEWRFRLFPWISSCSTGWEVWHDSTTINCGQPQIQMSPGRYQELIQ